jgi:hypothetical protein
VTKEDKIKLSLGNFVTNISEAISARTHLMRESAVRWVFAPLLYFTVVIFVALLVLDALHAIPPMRDSLLSVIKVVLGAGVLGAGFGWLFERKSN